MFLGFLKPLLEEADLINENDASDPMNTTIGLADTAAMTEFMTSGFESVGGMGDGINFDAITPQTPELAPTIAPQTPTLAGNAPGMDMGMGPK